jgi:Fe-S cluster biogenesis protein NfuA
MSATTATTAEQAGRRVEEILDQLADSGDDRARAAAEELVRGLMEFYGAGLARVVALAGRADALDGLLGDELVASLLVLHGLHPDDLPTRIARALERVGHSVEIESLDESIGVLRLRVTAATGCGCPSTQDAVRQAAVDALSCFAPEVTQVEMVTASREPGLLQISTGPPRVAASGARPPAATP